MKCHPTHNPTTNSKANSSARFPCHTVLMALMLIVSGAFSPVASQYAESDSTYRQCFVGSTAFVLLNLVPDDNSPDFFQINLGYRLSNVDVISVELKTWKYGWPLGIAPTSDDFEADDTGFPGYIREFGPALAYQRFLWDGLYAGVHVMGAFQSFVDESGAKIDDGFQIFNTYRLGYHIKLWDDTLFIEPSFAITHRPYHTEMPSAFKLEDDKWSKFNFEPGLHFGFNF